MYCMPQVGTHASLYFPDGSASNAIVVGAIRKNGGTHASKRYFGTEHGSELEMTPTSIQLAGSPESLKVSFDDDAGVHFSSHKKLTLGATGDISLYTPKKIMLSAQSQIFVRKTQVSNGFTIESEYHVLGEKVRADGTDRTTFPDYQDNPVEDTASEKEGFSWGKLFGVVVAAVALTVSTFGAGAVVGAALVGAAIGAVGAIGGKISIGSCKWRDEQSLGVCKKCYDWCANGCSVRCNIWSLWGGVLVAASNNRANRKNNSLLI